MRFTLARQPRRSLFAWMATTALLVYGGAWAQVPPLDVDVTAAIETEIGRDEFVPFNPIDVATRDGIVTLTGTVENLAAKTRASAIAAMVKGVRGVVNRIDVKASMRPRDALATEVDAAFDTLRAPDGYEIDVAVSAEGSVTLTGEVDSWAERFLAEKVVETVDGVTAIVNDLSVDQSRVFRNEIEIQDDILSRLNWDVRVDGSLIDVLVKEGGRVTLSGTVGSLSEKQLATELAWVAGVSEVYAEALDVERWARDEDLRRGKYERRADADVQAALLRAFAYDPRLLRDDIDARVRSGRVWLSGVVSDVRAKRAAEQDAYNTVGVDRVVNHLKVRAEERSDAELQTLIVRALEQYRSVADDSIDVSVNGRRVTLAGDVDSNVEFWRVDQTASAVSGVEEVSNRLTIGGEQPTVVTSLYGGYPDVMTVSDGPSVGVAKTDRHIIQDFRSELFWSPFVDEGDIEFDVENGVITLRGVVESPLERRAARDNAFDAGAIAVRDQLVAAE